MTYLISENKLLVSAAFVVFVLVLRWALQSALRRRHYDEEGLLNKRWINHIDKLSSLLIMVGLVVIWLSELKYVALSIAAFVVSLVIATREFIQCYIGALYISSVRMFNLGDWIKIGPDAGEVVDSDWLSTTLLEVDLDSPSYSYTGRTLYIPNNRFIGAALQNLNFMRRYVNHSFHLIREAENVNVLEAKQMILQKAREYCQPFEQTATRYASLIANKLGAGTVSVEPSVRVTTTNLGKNQFTVSVFCPTEQALMIEQQLTEDFFTFWYTQQEQSKTKKETKTIKPLYRKPSKTRR